MVLPYLVAQDGLLDQPRVAIQADPGIAPAPHLRVLPGPDRPCRGGTPETVAAERACFPNTTAWVSSRDSARLWALETF